jgi:sialate O-acetylesterase
MRICTFRLALAALAILLSPIVGIAGAAVTPHPLFSEGAVIQRGKPVPVWGTASPGEKVTVKLQDQQATTTASDGKWSVTLQPLQAGGPLTMVITGDKTPAPVELKDVLVGEVWICSGQSNMAMTLKTTDGADEAIAASNDPMLRLFTVPRGTSQAERTDMSAANFTIKAGRDAWKPAGPDSVPSFSAVAYYFGRDLRKALGVPVGLIHTSVGGTPAEAWTRRAALEAEPALANVFEADARAMADYPQALERFKVAQETHKKAVAEAKEKGEKPPQAPRPPAGPNSTGRPAVLYNAMVAPLVPYAIEGAIWYQGESNAGRAYQYQTLLSSMIKSWRGAWNQGDFPFLIVQLAPYMKIVTEPGESAWAELREAQLKTTKSVPNTALAVITDVGEENDVHPKKKAPVGARLALAARAIAYGEKNLEYSGPEYLGMEVKDGKAVLRLSHVGAGLVSRGGALKGFSIAGDDRTFVNADAEIQGDTVIVQSPSVPNPVAVRYGWANYPLGNLWNNDGLPASPFRTDEFPLSTRPGNNARRPIRASVSPP